MEMKDMSEKCVDVAKLLKNFSHPQRLLILCYLCEGEHPVSEIQEAVGLSQSQTSQFLTRMTSEGLLSSRREKNFTYYSIANKQVSQLVTAMQKIFC
jgi:ArsR family transcriptional regulator, virulence genes transcriptional regulator